VTSQKRAEAEIVLRTLLRTREELGSLTTSEIAEAAELCEVVPETVKHWLEAGRVAPGKRPRFKATQRDREVFYQARGRMARAYALRKAEEPALRSRRTWEKAVREELTPAQRASASGGHAARLQKSLVLSFEVDAPNERWEIDSQEMKVKVKPPHGGAPERPWITTCQDSFSRAITGLELSMQPNATVALAALHSAVTIEQARGPFGGIPELIVFDNGREYLSGEFTHALQVLGVIPSVADPYAPQQKPRIERFFRTLTDEFASQHPSFVRPPRRADGTPYGPDPVHMSFERLYAEVAAWIWDRYNTSRSHGGLNGHTPLQRWESASFTPRLEPAKDLAFLLKERVTRKVGRYGVELDGIKFIAPGLVPLGSETVEIAYRPYDRSRIEVFRDDEWVCSAVPHSALDEATRHQILALRREDNRGALELHRNNAARQRALLDLGPDSSEGAAEPADRPSKTLRPSTSLFDFDERSRFHR
jgi:putative transposase